MLSTLSPMSTEFVTGMNRISERMSRAQRQIASGIRVENVSDEPDSVSTILQVRADVSSNDQILSNLSRVKTETDTAEQSVSSAVSLVERARVLGAQGSTGTATAESRTSLADEVGAILEQVVGLTRTSVEGRYIFSGDSDHVAPYSVDLSADPPVSAYAGSALTRQVQHPNGTRFSVGTTAQAIFDSDQAGKNVFKALSDLRTGLSNSDPALLSTAMSDIGSSLDYLNSQLATYGTVQKKVADATAFGNERKVQLQTHLTSVQEADLTESIVELTQAQLQQSAALQAQAKMPRSSLFDFLG